MTVSTAYSVLSFAGNGTTTAFAVSWPFFTGSLVVILKASTGAESTKVITTHYTVAGGTDANLFPFVGLGAVLLNSMYQYPESKTETRTGFETTGQLGLKIRLGGSFFLNVQPTVTYRVDEIRKSTRFGIATGLSGFIGL